MIKRFYVYHGVAHCTLGGEKRFSGLCTTETFLPISGKAYRSTRESVTADYKDDAQPNNVHILAFNRI
jgi:hypothetical protein